MGRAFGFRLSAFASTIGSGARALTRAGESRKPKAESLIAATALVLLATTAASAAEVRFDGAYRLLFHGNTNYLLDPSQKVDQKAWAEHRLRLTPKIVDQERVEIQAQFDVLSGLVGGDLAPSFGELGWTDRSQRNGLRARGFDFRYLYLSLRLPVGLIQIGQMPNHWGLGLVANNGEAMDGGDFGDLRFGDIVDGFLFGTRPLSFLGPRSKLAEQVVAGLAAHVVYRDRIASLVNRAGDGLAWGDVALQGILFARWEPSELTRVGVYAARRSQSFARDTGDLKVWVFDAHARTELIFPKLGGSLRFELEAAEIFGSTTHAANLNASSVRIAQQGLVGRVTATRNDIEAELELGYASGDSNPFDDVATNFTGNRDYKVGLVLWDELMLFQTQNGARRLGDPNLSGRPPNGIDLLPTQGAISNVLYLNPKVRFRPPFFGGSLRAVVGVLWSRAPQAVVDPYQSFLASAPRNVFGSGAGRDYGTEFDASLSFKMPFSKDRQIGAEVGAQYGVLLPGDVFTRQDGSRLGPVQAFKIRSTFYF